MANAIREDGPAWPTNHPISPTVIKNYLECPHRVRLHSIERTPGTPDVPSLALEKGKAAHHVLKDCAWRLKAGRPPRTIQEMHENIFRRLERRHFPSREAHESHAREVLRWVRYGIGYISSGAEFLVIEGKTYRSAPRIIHSSPPQVMTQADLVLVHTQPDGERWVEFIDYKTGMHTEIPHVPVLTRYVLRKRLLNVVPNPTTADMRFTFLWLDAQTPESIDLSLDYCEYHWQETTLLLQAIVNDREWRARPSAWACRFCQYKQGLCDAYQRLEGNDLPDRVNGVMLRTR